MNIVNVKNNYGKVIFEINIKPCWDSLSENIDSFEEHIKYKNVD